MLEARRVLSAQEWADFFGFTSRRDERWLLDVERNPYFRQAYLYPLVAYRAGKPVARVVGLVDDRHTRAQRELVAFFGCLVSQEDPEAVALLLERVGQWAKGRGMGALRGPFSPDRLEAPGLDAVGAGLGTWLEKAGFSVRMEGVIFNAKAREPVPERLVTVAERLKRDRGWTVRPLDSGQGLSSLESLFSLALKGWDAAWGPVPPASEELGPLVARLKPRLDPRLGFLLEEKGRPVAGVLAVAARSGKLLTYRVALSAVAKERQGRGASLVLYAELLRAASAAGYAEGEMPAIASGNRAGLKLAGRFMGQPSRRVRVYEKRLAR